uniref:Sushi domain-containing protein n=1 Tax=Gopherus evgoodei TaxID=1825980 RepID=A0A8C4XXS1_9SAUR
CEISGTRVAWSGDIPICERIPCLPPPDIPNGRRTLMKNFFYGSAVTYKCNSGYPLIGEASIHCTTEDGLNGVWSARPPRCGATCVSPEVENGRTNGVQPAYRPRDIVVFECDPGYTLSGSPKTQCQDDGRWDPPVPVCERMLQCPSPPAITNGKPSRRDLAVFTSGMSVNYSCEPGYSLTGQASIYCMASGTWSPPPPQCEGKCVPPKAERPVLPRDTVRFECDPGYTLNGSRQIQCQDEGTWDPPVPVCIQVTCVSPEVGNGRTNGVQPAYRPRDIVVFKCNPGYTLSGSPETQCQDDGRWDPPVPVCERSKCDYGYVYSMKLGRIYRSRFFKNRFYTVDCVCPHLRPLTWRSASTVPRLMLTFGAWHCE